MPGNSFNPCMSILNKRQFYIDGDYSLDDLKMYY